MHRWSIHKQHYRTRPQQSKQLNYCDARTDGAQARLKHTMIKSAAQEQQLLKSLGQEEHAFSTSPRTSHDFYQSHCGRDRQTKGVLWLGDVSIRHGGGEKV